MGSPLIPKWYFYPRFGLVLLMSHEYFFNMEDKIFYFFFVSTSKFLTLRFSPYCCCLGNYNLLLCFILGDCSKVSNLQDTATYFILFF